MAIKTSQVDLGHKFSNDFIEEFLEKLDRVRNSTTLLRDFLVKVAIVTPRPCQLCPKKSCSKPCEALEVLLPKPYAGKGDREVNINLDFDKFESHTASHPNIYGNEQRQSQSDYSKLKYISRTTYLDVFEEYRKYWPKFTDKQRELLALKYRDGKTQTQIAKQLGKSPSAISGRLKRAVQQLEVFQDKERQKRWTSKEKK